jgi:Ni/Co efflux regulator RcnB
MKKYLAVILGAALLAGSGATAQPYRNDNARHDQRYEQGRDSQSNAHRWARGQRMSAEYRNAHSRYRVADYRRYHLYAPGRGRQWVRVNNDYLLVGLASGLIADVVRHQ